MKRTGAQLAVYALEQLGVRHTFGIPGVHNIELYDCLADSTSIRPVRVSHEGCAAFMADAISRTSDSVGTLAIVPAAGTLLAAAGIAEAYLDGIPMLVISGGIRSDTGRRYQVHDIDQEKLVAGFTKAFFRVKDQESVVPTLYEAYRVATGDEPGPVFVEIPADVQMFTKEVPEPPAWRPALQVPGVPAEAVAQAAQMLAQARHPGLFLGWGAHRASDLAVALAERLGAPAVTSLQGLSVFPASHPLHAGMGFGPAAVPAATDAFRDCDCLLAVGVRFGEIATGSYSIDTKWKLIHVDINPEMFNANYPAEIAIHGDAAQVMQALLDALPPQSRDWAERGSDVGGRIAERKSAYRAEWLQHDSQGRVNPARFFDRLRTSLPDEAIVVADDGNHTFLVAELFPVHGSRRFISPTDFNCMGYAVPAAIGAGLANPGVPVVGIVGDGAFMMTCMELSTAAELGLGIVYFVFNDGELSQIAQAQKLPYNRKACTVLPDVRISGVAQATGVDYLEMRDNDAVDSVMAQALQAAQQGRPVVVDVKVDYSKATRFTQGVLRANLGRMPLGMKLRLVGRAVTRRVFPPEEAVT